MVDASLPDPHNVSNSLDKETSARIIDRLESRGKDAVFRSLFESYFPRLFSCRRVLEVGCGTGVLVRALIQRKEFSGCIVGLDQSAEFLQAARSLAEAEGCDMARISFVEADAQSQHCIGPPFDAVIMHTLLSHVSFPKQVLEQAHEMAAAGALLIVMDGDYSSVSYACLSDPDLGRSMDHALVSATFAQPQVVRELPCLLASTNWTLQQATSKCVSEIGHKASYWVSFAKAYMPRVIQAQLVAEEDVKAWWSLQETALQEGHFFAVGNYFTYFAYSGPLNGSANVLLPTHTEMHTNIADTRELNPMKQETRSLSEQCFNPLGLPTLSNDLPPACNELVTSPENSEGVFRRAFWQRRVADDVSLSLRQQLEVSVEGGPSDQYPAPVQSFQEIDVLPSYVVSSLARMNCLTPLPIQAQALPIILGGFDLIGIAKTGSGKTLAFLLPALVHIEAQKPLPSNSAAPIALVLAPTRELSSQIKEEACKLTVNSRQGNHPRGLRAQEIYGGAKRMDQLYNARGAAILVATPGRLTDFVENREISLHRVTYFVLDEADRMLDLGFICDVDNFARHIRPDRHMLFFSATWPAEVQSLAAGLCNDSEPVLLKVGQKDGGEFSTRHDIIQEVVVFDQPTWDERDNAKQALLYSHVLQILQADPLNKILVFVNNKTLADELKRIMQKEGFLTDSMHGGRTQSDRENALARFKRGNIRLLVATDVMGRGLDIPTISHIVQYDMCEIEDYIHRIGRSARGVVDRAGHALTLFEYYPTMPRLAHSLIKVMLEHEQHVPDDLRRIAHEVDSGTRDIRSGHSKKKKPPTAALMRGQQHWQDASEPSWKSVANVHKSANVQASPNCISQERIVEVRTSGYSQPTPNYRSREPTAGLPSQQNLDKQATENFAANVGWSNHDNKNNRDKRTNKAFKVWLGGLPDCITEKEICFIFSASGVVEEVRILKRGSAMLRFSKPTEAQHAIQSLNGYVFKGSAIEVDRWT